MSTENPQNQAPNPEPKPTENSEAPAPVIDPEPEPVNDPEPEPEPEPKTMPLEDRTDPDTEGTNKNILTNDDVIKKLGTPKKSTAAKSAPGAGKVFKKNAPIEGQTKVETPWSFFGFRSFWPSDWPW